MDAVKLILAAANYAVATLNVLSGAESRELRDDLETQRETAWQNTKRNAREYKRVCDENDRLRELAKNLKACNSSCGRCIELYGKCDYETELRELGIEVK